MMIDCKKIFGIGSQKEFEAIALEVFSYQYQNESTYQEFCNYIGKNTKTVNKISDIPFLPIQFFKSKKIVIGSNPSQAIFTSSGTSGNNISKHYVRDISLYEKSYSQGFRHFYREVSDYCILALLPSYLEREGSSLIYMVHDLIKKSNHPDSGFYLSNLEGLKDKLIQLESKSVKTILIGVSFALLDFVEQFPLKLKHTIVMETGGMKGRRREMVREELHSVLSNGFGVERVHSEYGMTELLSQAYSQGYGIFNTPPWMKVVTRDTEDPFSKQIEGKSGGINIIDLANINSCSFIATQDLGKVYQDGRFEIIGRFDHSDIRGCNLMVL